MLAKWFGHTFLFTHLQEQGKDGSSSMLRKPGRFGREVEIHYDTHRFLYKWPANIGDFILEWVGLNGLRSHSILNPQS